MRNNKVGETRQYKALLAILTISPPSPATNKSMQMTRQDMMVNSTNVTTLPISKNAPFERGKNGIYLFIYLLFTGSIAMKR